EPFTMVALVANGLRACRILIVITQQHDPNRDACSQKGTDHMPPFGSFLRFGYWVILERAARLDVSRHSFARGSRCDGEDNAGLDANGASIREDDPPASS